MKIKDTSAQEDFEAKLKESMDKSFRKINAEIDAVKDKKERLRRALVNAGYDIPKGLSLDEWIPYIERGCAHEYSERDYEN